MKTIIFNVFCSGVYEAKLDVDDYFCSDDLDKMSDEEFEKIHSYVCQHLDEAYMMSDIEWIADIDVDAEDIREIIAH